MFKLIQEQNPQAEHITNKYLKNDTIIARQYQISIAKNCLLQNTAVILPTGLGKTIIAFLVIAEILPKRVLFLAPTKPLVMQHYENCKRFVNIEERKVIMLSGSIPQKKRALQFDSGTIIISTPQTIKNDIFKGLYTLEDIHLIIFDEMHKAVEKYAYVELAKKFNGLILGLTASPGSKKKKINQIFENLKINNIERRLREDTDVKEHIKDIRIEWIKVQMNVALKEILEQLNRLFLQSIKKLNKVGILTYKKPKYLSKKDILASRLSIKKRFGRRPYAFAIYNIQSVLLHTYHCLELIETQGIAPFLKYIENLNSRDKLSKSEKTFLNKDELREAVDIAQKHNHISHPKLVMLRQIVETQFQSEPDSLIIIFTQYRNTIESIEGVLTGIRDTKAQRFIGQGMQSNVRGMTQNQQKEVIENFRKREINVLIATSVAEEGIDIPNVNLVIFYEPLPSEIRTIQREGRTGRTHIGKVAILITEGTRDEAYLYAGMQKKKKMQRIVKELKSSRIWH